jgi:hypothetical protein
MLEFTLHLEDCDPTQNIWCAYSIAARQNLFGKEIVVLTYWPDRRTKPDKS